MTQLVRADPKASRGVEPRLDWNDVRFFIAVARARGMSRAAEQLGVDQTTVGRRLASLEARLRVALFSRSSRGLALTAAGERALAAAERMQEAALDVWSEAVSDSAAPAGTVRVATTSSLAPAFVIPAVRRLHERHANIHVMLVSSWARLDLRAGEADVAVRLVRPTDPRLAGRKLADFALRLYAARDYVARRGMPESLQRHQLIAYDETVRGGRPPLFTDVPTDGSTLAFSTNSGTALLQAARAGIGIAELPSFVGDAEPSLVRVLPAHQHPYSVWLVVPQARRRVAVVRALCDAIVAEFSAAPRPAPAPADRSPKRAPRRR